jgi:hypothetical protein
LRRGQIEWRNPDNAFLHSSGLAGMGGKIYIFTISPLNRAGNPSF